MRGETYEPCTDVKRDVLRFVVSFFIALHQIVALIAHTPIGKHTGSGHDHGHAYLAYPQTKNGGPSQDRRLTSMLP